MKKYLAALILIFASLGASGCIAVVDGGPYEGPYYYRYHRHYRYQYGWCGYCHHYHEGYCY